MSTQEESTVANDAGVDSDTQALTDKMAQTSVSDVFTGEERAAFKAVREALVAAGVSADRLFDRDIGVVTMIEKCRVEKAVEKYQGYLQALKNFDITLAQLHDESTMADLPTWTAYHPCGPDNAGRGIMFIAGEGIPKEHEAAAVRAGFLYWMAVHSDLVSIREGITFVIDQSYNSKPVGNERKMQKVWSALPMRPQHFFISSAGFVKRIFINALIKFASVFSNSKILKRIKFVEKPEVLAVIPKDNVPSIYGGPVSRPALEYVKERLAVSKAWFE